MYDPKLLIDTIRRLDIGLEADQYEPREYLELRSWKRDDNAQDETATRLFRELLRAELAKHERIDIGDVVLEEIDGRAA